MTEIIDEATPDLSSFDKMPSHSVGNADRGLPQPSATQIAFRFFHLVSTLCGYGSIYIFRRLSGRDARHRAAGEFLASACDRLGGAFVKMGQLLSTRADLLPPEIIERLTHLRNRVPPFAARLSDEAQRTLLPQTLRAALATLDPEPIAAAGVAQVHRGRLHDGRAVAIKLRRPSVALEIACDLRIVDGLAAAAGRIPGLRMLPVRSIFGEVNDAIARQVDFTREAAAADRLRRAFACHTGIHIPAVVHEHTRPDCLVLEFVEGLTPIEHAIFDAGARKHAARNAIIMLFEMAFLEGLVHCDMHPGNLFFRPDGRLVLLDFGFVCDLDLPTHNAYTDFFMGFANNDGRRCARVITETALARPSNFDHGAFDKAMAALIARHHARNARDFEVAQFAVELFETQRRFRISGSTAFTMTIVGFLVLEGVIKLLDPEMDFQGEARRFFEERAIWRRFFSDRALLQERADAARAAG